MTGRSDTLSLAEARRIALAAQGFADGRPPARCDRRHLARVLDRVGLLQIDSVNVLVRSHYLPLFSRLGTYPMEVVDRLAYGRKPRTLFEYWGHMASLLPVALHPLLRWRMDRASRGDRIYKGIARFGDEKRAYIERVLKEVRDRGPLAVSDLSEGAENQGSWWGWGDGKMALEWLFYAGKVTTAHRRGFERIYDLPERVLPTEILALPTPPEDEAQRQLMEIGARAHGIATAFDLRDYFRLPPEDAKARTRELVEAGRLKPVRVEGWKEPAYLHVDAAIPRRLTTQALLSPSIPWCGCAIAASGSSISTTASASTRRRTSGRMATTCCRSCSVTGWWRASISRQIDRTTGSRCWAPILRATPRSATSPSRSRKNSRGWPPGSASSASR